MMSMGELRLPQVTVDAAMAAAARAAAGAAARPSRPRHFEASQEPHKLLGDFEEEGAAEGSQVGRGVHVFFRTQLGVPGATVPLSVQQGNSSSICMLAVPVLSSQQLCS
jgi:hypothetical protein